MNWPRLWSTSLWTIAALCLVSLSANAAAQDLDDFGLGGGLDFGGSKKKRVFVEASFEPSKEAGRGTLVLKATIEKGWHIYSTSQKPGGPIATKIKLDESKQYRKGGEITYSPKAEIHHYEWWPKLDVEEHYREVTWRVPLEFGGIPDGTKELTIKGIVDTQVCDESRCQPTKIPFTLAIAPPAGSKEPLAARAITPPTKLTGLPLGSQTSKHVSIITTYEPGTIPGHGTLVIAASIDPGWHIYSITQPKGGPQPTVIKLDESAEFKRDGEISESPAPKISEKSVWPGVQIEEHRGTVTWRVPMFISPKEATSELQIKGVVETQVCDDPIRTCIPTKLPFELMIDANGIPVAASDPTNVESGPPASSQSLPYLLLLGFAGGMILNLMPCVLPVIGLKVFAFIEQAGQDRRRVFMLNLWYSLGVISVFMALAMLAVVFQLGWGQLFQYAEFNIAMAAVIFVMGLSFLGIWEIPIPGFMGTSKVTEIGEKEGYEGAFAKGTITTLLATPCTGPFMSTALVGVLARPSSEIFGIFFAIGLGMATPYLLIGAFPQLVKFLPKPGEWMNTFKQVMGFVLLGTVVYLLTLLDYQFVIPTVAMLFGLWMSCWWIGRVSVTAGSERKWQALGEASLVSVVVGLVAFYWLAPVMNARFEYDVNRIAEVRAEKLIDESGGEFTVRNELWQPYTDRKLEWLQANNKTVLVDFTADWCQTCKVMEATVLKTKNTEKLLGELNVYTLVADWTHKDEANEVTKKLKELGSAQIPLLAIYPAGGDPKKPILIPGTYTSGYLYEKIRQAGASQEADTPTGVAAK